MTDAEIHREAYRRYPEPTDVLTGEPMDDWGYAECERTAFIAGARWARG